MDTPAQDITGSILAVDDTPSALRLLTDILISEKYQVRSAINGELALRAAALEPPELILLDVNMPDIDGYEVCRRLKKDDQLRHIPVIFVSAFSEIQDILKGFNLGAVDYVTKPFHREELLARVRTHLELNRLRNHLEDMVEKRTMSLRRSEVSLKKSLFEFVSAVATIVEMRDPYTSGHQQRVAQLATAIAHELKMPKKQIEGLHLASTVHDVGKFSIPAELLSKPGQLTPLEQEIIKQHPQAGYDILKSIDFPWPIAKIVQQHHERIDGSGYPNRLKKESIQIEARIIAVADVVEAMASHRPYRPSKGLDVALDEITRQSGILYDSEIVKTCVDLIKNKQFQFTEIQPTEAPFHR